MTKKSWMIVAFVLALPPLAYHATGDQAEADQATSPQIAPLQIADAAGLAADQAFQAGMVKMHKGMMIKYSGDADIDFVKSMLPHHQGAVDMAKVELQYGKDPEMKKLAQDIVDAQETEIGTMQDWLKKQGQ